MSDLVERLRARQAPVGIDKDAAGFVVYHTQDALCSEAADEIERLRKDAERGRWMIKHAAWHRVDRIGERHASMVVRLPYESDLSCVAMREIAIDAAMQAKEHG